LIVSTAAVAAFCGTALAQDHLSNMFFVVEGAYWFDGALDTEHGIPGFTVSTTTGDGTGARGQLGYRFGPLPASASVRGTAASCSTCTTPSRVIRSS
jgi:hypothetical protein